jgi:urea transport system substrate-binding protein
MAKKRLKIGLLIPRLGPAGIWAPSCEASAIMAVAELNAVGGILGRQIDLVIADAGDTDASAAGAASTLTWAVRPSVARWSPLEFKIRKCL